MPDVEPTPTPAPVDAPAPTAQTGGEVVARRDRAHWVKRCVLIPGLIVFCGLYFLYDGHVGYPAANRQFDDLTRKAKDARDRSDPKGEADLLQERKSVTRHDEFQLRLQRQLGYGLLPLGVLAFAYFSRQSRGQYRLAGDVLYAPGHPPIPLDSVRQIDKTKWAKKGIAYIDYELESPAGGSGSVGRVRLDDALYEQEPTTAILRTIEAKVAPAAEDAGVTRDASDVDDGTAAIGGAASENANNEQR